MDSNHIAGAASSSGMAALDWIVVAVYMLGTLAVGWYFARRAKTTEDYLLGGREMKSFWVGLSLFATMLSAVSYLMIPGEIVKNGPAYIMGKIAAYPFVILIVGFVLIPIIMRLKITSAYEMLETRLGLGVRMLGSVFFLMLRFMWMATILYATATKVLVPLLGLSESSSIYLSAGLALITIIYTSMGGLKAVVFTDVVQTFILFFGAFLTIGLIAWHLGGINECVPTEWPAHWPEFQWGLGSGSKARTFSAALIGTLVWFVSTSGSDQMAIQRYLSTKDAKTARRSVIFSMVTSALAGILLAFVGLSVMAYFQAEPQQLARGLNVINDADKIFPLYITNELPAGLSGLVLAGLLAAAMSSLSSGMNSACSVITVDFIDRFRKSEKTEINHVKMAKHITVYIGIVVVLLSSIVGMVQGNLLDLAFKVCNLLTVPLFGLFFMAMFVRWASGAGTLMGAAAGFITVFTISFWEDLFAGPTGMQGISVLWAMPLCLLVQVSVGMLASKLFGEPRPPLDKAE